MQEKRGTCTGASTLAAASTQSEGLGVALGGSRARAWECFWGALGGLWLQISLSKIV